MKKNLILVLAFLWIQNIYAQKDYPTWKQVKSEFKWSTTTLLWCRYKKSNGEIFENAGRLSDKKTILTYASNKNTQNFLWSCPDPYDPFYNIHRCPHLLSDSRYNYSNNWFVVNDLTNKSLGDNFAQEAENSCRNFTPHHDYEFVEYGIKSTADLLSSLFHRPFYSRAPDLSRNLPFSRIVVFGDSLTDRGNSFSTLSYPKWPYFMGRFSNGRIWVEYIAQSLIQNEQEQFDLYDYATGGGGVTNPSYNPFGIFYKQVKNYLTLSEQGQQDKILDPAYESTLFVIFVGSNDYMVLTQNGGLLDKLLYCKPNAPEKCAQRVVEGIKTEIENILKTSQNKAKYFLIPTQPDITLAPYYQKLSDPNAQEKTFASQAILAHNKYLSQALDEIEHNYPNIKILRLDLSHVIGSMVKNPNDVRVQESRISNTTDACFSGSAKNLKNQTVCADPASYMFWDGIHLSTTTNCDLGEYAVSEIYKVFANTSISYVPQYNKCHLTDVK